MGEFIIGIVVLVAGIALLYGIQRDRERGRLYPWRYPLFCHMCKANVDAGDTYMFAGSLRMLYCPNCEQEVQDHRPPRWSREAREAAHKQLEDANKEGAD